MKLTDICEKIIAYSFYALFFFVPLVLTNDTSELFELNKMWITWILAILIACAWFTRMTVQRQVRIQRSILDIPLLLFLLSQVLSTLFSLDSRISFWGYYSRFNGGLLATITYIFLYYAFISNLSIKHVYKTLVISLVTGAIVAVWGFPAHFGKDPTCLLFRGTFDISCWTEAFQPKIRIFSTIGQPAWLAAYLAALLPLAIAYTIQKTRNLKQMHAKTYVLVACCVTLVALFYADLIFANTRAGFMAFWVGFFIFAGILLRRSLIRGRMLKALAFCTLSLLVINFFLGIPIGPLQQFTLSGIQHRTTTVDAPIVPTTAPTGTSTSPAPAGELGGTDSGLIRQYVWKGAIDAWKANPLFGTGVETFAFAYYQFRPTGHNSTSEWDYLYNKAHNEYLNFLTTSGLLGLGTYLAWIGIFLYAAFRFLIRQSEEKKNNVLFTAALVSSFITILFSNFFGFSVVIINLYFFLIPAFVFILQEKFNPNHVLLLPKTVPEKTGSVGLGRLTIIMTICLLGLFLIYKLIVFWNADKAYALGNNLNRIGAYDQAYPYLQKAVTARGNEPVFTDELAINNAALAYAYFQQKQDASTAAQLAQNAIKLSDSVIASHPNNIVYWKDRVRIFYNLSQVDANYLSPALLAMQQVVKLSPTDAKGHYNLGVLYGQIGDYTKAIQILNETRLLKADYRDVYFAMGLFYHEMAKDKNGIIVKSEMQIKAEEAMQKALSLSPNDADIPKTLEEWKNGK